MFIETDSLDSTNEEAKRLIGAGAGEGTIIWAKEQTKGVGRRGKQWASPPGNLYFSVIVESGEAPVEQFSLFASCVLSSVIGWTLNDTSLLSYKWPNDILVSGQKIAGLLLETFQGEGPGSFLIIGCGVNLVSCPEVSYFPATFLARESDLDINAYRLLSRFLSEYDVWWQLWQTKGFPFIVGNLNAKLWRQGQRIRIENEAVDKPVEGICIGLNKNGHLRIRLEEGEQVLSTAAIFEPQA